MPILFGTLGRIFRMCLHTPWLLPGVKFALPTGHVSSCMGLGVGRRWPKRNGSWSRFIHFPYIFKNFTGYHFRYQVLKFCLFILVNHIFLLWYPVFDIFLIKFSTFSLIDSRLFLDIFYHTVLSCEEALGLCFKFLNE